MASVGRGLPAGCHPVLPILGIQIRGILTDNSSCYRSRAFRKTCMDLGIRHRFTKPNRPRTNDKAERFIQTLLREWAYAAAYQNSAHRTARLAPWLHLYNWHHPHVVWSIG